MLFMKCITFFILSILLLSAGIGEEAKASTSSVNHLCQANQELNNLIKLNSGKSRNQSQISELSTSIEKINLDLLYGYVQQAGLASLFGKTASSKAKSKVSLSVNSLRIDFSHLTRIKKNDLVKNTKLIDTTAKRESKRLSSYC